jgi:hypothetical protein
MIAFSCKASHLSDSESSSELDFLEDIVMAAH